MLRRDVLAHSDERLANGTCLGGVALVVEISSPGAPQAIGISLDVFGSLADLDEIGLLPLLFGEILERLDAPVNPVAEEGLDPFLLWNVARCVLLRVWHDGACFVALGFGGDDGGRKFKIGENGSFATWRRGATMEGAS